MFQNDVAADGRDGLIFTEFVDPVDPAGCGAQHFKHRDGGRDQAIGPGAPRAGYQCVRITDSVADGRDTGILAQRFTPRPFQPAAQFGSYASYILILIGAMVNAMGLIEVGIVLFSVAVLFSVVTLPVEWNASARAKELMVSSGIVSHDEQVAAGKVLNAAFLTYLSGLCSRRFTATQYALLSSVPAFAVHTIGGASGVLAGALGWVSFYGLCMFAALPAMALMLFLLKRHPPEEAAAI